MCEDFEAAGCWNDSAAHQGVLLQRLNGLPYGGSETNCYFGKILGNKVIAKLAHHIVASGLTVGNLHERGPIYARQAKRPFARSPNPRIRLLSVPSTPNLPPARRPVLPAYPQSQARALFDGGQGRIHNFLNRLVAAPANNVLNPTFLFWCELDCHTLPPFAFFTFRIRENLCWNNVVERHADSTRQI